MPIEIDPVKSAQQRSDYHGIYLLENFSRLREVTLTNSGEVVVDLKCTYDEQGLPIMLVTAKTDVEVTCQRCNGSLSCSVNFTVTYTPKTSTLDEDLVPSDYEVAELNEYGCLDFRALVEDELMLALPIVPKHSVDECGVTEDDMSWGELGEEAEAEPANPFDVLKSLKKPK